MEAKLSANDKIDFAGTNEVSANSFNHSSQTNLTLDYFFKMLNTALKMLDTEIENRG